LNSVAKPSDEAFIVADQFYVPLGLGVAKNRELMNETYKGEYSVSFSAKRGLLGSWGGSGARCNAGSIGKADRPAKRHGVVKRGAVTDVEKVGVDIVIVWVELGHHVEHPIAIVIHF
jgi:hypothetical protein